MAQPSLHYDVMIGHLIYPRELSFTVTINLCKKGYKGKCKKQFIVNLLMMGLQ